MAVHNTPLPISPGKSKSNDFLIHPRRSWLRRAAFQIHLWSGLLIGLYVIAISLTGSVLVFEDELLHTFSPALFEVAQPARDGSLDVVLRLVNSRYPLFHAIGIDNLHSSGEPLLVYLEPAAPHPSTDQLMTYLDRGRGHLLGTRWRYKGFLGWCANVHYYLLAGEPGYTANGVLAVLFAAVCFSGWLLWWPGMRHWAKGFRIHWRARPKRLIWDLHTVFGFWSNTALLIVVLTGIYFVFPRPFLHVLAKLSGDDEQVINAHLASPSSDTHYAGMPVTLDVVRANMQRSLDPGANIKYLALPSGPTGTYLGIGYASKAAPFAEPIDIYADRGTGAILRVEDARHWRWGLRYATFVYAIHFGSFVGLASKILWFLLGLFSSGLAVTGFLLYWNRYLSRIWRDRAII